VDSNKWVQRLEKNPPLLLALAFAVVILIGGSILASPLADVQGKGTPFIDAIFTSTSAVCVTGLVTLNTADHWNTFGHVVIICLIQFGGLGFMTTAGTIAMILRKKITLSDRMVIQEETNSSTLSGMVKLIRYILKATFVIESIGAVLLATRFIPQYGWRKGLWFSVFHSISSFCNAGFDIIGSESISAYAGDVVVILTIGSLIVLGGIGFNVYRDVLQKNRWKKLSLHSKVALSATGLLLVGGTLVIFLLERNNPGTLGGRPLGTQVLGAFFQSVTTRTAGYFSMNQELMRDTTAVFSIILMFIGGSPAGTAGGIKTTTLALILLTTYADIKGRRNVGVFHRRIAEGTIKRAVSLTVLSFSWVLVISFLLTITDAQFEFINLLFEEVSAFGTVGLTRGVTPGLSTIGKVLILITMYIGKLGPITFVFALTRREKKEAYQDALGSILIG
jgi:trk system potassium uptake protein TrkH